MALSVAPMALADLAAYLVSTGEYATIAEAMAALNIVIVDGVGATGTAIAVSGGAASTAVGTVGETALELAARSQLQATGTGVATAGIGVLQQSTGYSISAILGMPVGVVAAAVAPYYGVKLGTAMYDSNPELWNKLSQKLLPFCYPGTAIIPTWAEIVESTWIVSVAKKIFGAEEEVFQEEGIGRPQDIETPTVHAGVATAGYQDGSVWIVSVEEGRPYFSQSGVVYYASHSPFTIVYIAWGGYRTRASGVYNDRYGIYTLEVGALGGDPQSPYQCESGDAFFRTVAAQPEYHYPPGTEEWTGTMPSELPEAKPAVIGLDDQGGAITTPTVPICPPIIIIPDPIIVPQPVPQTQPEIIPFPWPKPATVPEEEPWPETMPWPLPSTEPDWWPVEIPYPDTYPYQYPTQDPELQPDPSTVTDPKKQVDPYIWPSPFPYELPVPETKPITNTDADPSSPSRPTTQTPTEPPINLGPDPVGLSPIPAMPTTPLPFDLSQNVGLVTVYHPTPSELYSFERWLWVTYADATLDKIFNNPFDGVISLFELYCTPTDVGRQTIRSGFLDSQIQSNVISRYTEIDCGTLGIPEYYGNYFDYSPYSKAHIYLPFIGIQELNVDDIVGHAVNVKYRIDEYNGSCIAMITVAKVTEVNGESVEYSNTMYQFSGNCSVDLPFAGGSQAAIKAGYMTANAYQSAAGISTVAGITGGAVSALTGRFGSAFQQIIGGLAQYEAGQANALSHMLSGKSTVQKSGQFGSSHGALGIKTPYITVTRPKQIQVANYNEEYGYPAHKLVYIGDCTGFLRCREVHVVSTTATDEEKDAIEAMLKAGIYVTE